MTRGTSRAKRPATDEEDTAREREPNGTSVDAAPDKRKKARARDAEDVEHSDKENSDGRYVAGDGTFN